MGPQHGSASPAARAARRGGESERNGRQRKRDGFSMLEIVAVIVIIGAVLALALPRVQRITALTRVSGAQSVVAGDLRRTAGLAAQHRRPMVVRWDSLTSQLVARRLGSSEILLRRSLGQGSEYRLRVSITPDSAIILPSGLASLLCVRLEGGSAPDTVVRRVKLTDGGQARVLAPGADCT